LTTLYAFVIIIVLQNYEFSALEGFCHVCSIDKISRYFWYRDTNGTVCAINSTGLGYAHCAPAYSCFVYFTLITVVYSMRRILLSWNNVA